MVSNTDKPRSNNLISQKTLAKLISKSYRLSDDDIDFNQEIFYKVKKVNPKFLNYHIKLEIDELRDFYYGLTPDQIWKVFGKSINSKSNYPQKFEKGEKIKIVDGDFNGIVGLFVDYVDYP